MGLLELERYTEKIAAQIRVRVGHYIGDGDEAHLLSVLRSNGTVGVVLQSDCGPIQREA